MEDDDDEISPLPGSLAVGDWSERKQAAKCGRGKREGRKYSRQTSEEDLLDSESDRLSLSREDTLDLEASPRRRRRGTVEAPKKSNLYDTGYFDEEESAKEVTNKNFKAVVARVVSPVDGIRAR